MRIHGSKGSVALGVGSPALVVASLNKWALNLARDRVDVTAFGDSNKQYVQGLMDVKGTFAGFYDAGAGSPLDGNLSLFDAADGDVPVTLVLTPSDDAPTHYWTGLAYIDASIDVAANGAVTIAGSFAAAGPWTRAGS